MSNLERIVKQTSGIIKEDIRIKSFPKFIENTIAKGCGFPIFELSALSKIETKERARPIIAFSGKDTIPLITDPDSQIPGAFGIFDYKLLYDKTALGPLQDRDAYRWITPPWHYFIDATFLDIIKSFIKEEYQIYLVKPLSLLTEPPKPQIQSQTNLQEILKKLNIKQ